MLRQSGTDEGFFWAAHPWKKKKVAADMGQTRGSNWSSWLDRFLPWHSGFTLVKLGLHLGVYTRCDVMAAHGKKNSSCQQNASRSTRGVTRFRVQCLNHWAIKVPERPSRLHLTGSLHYSPLFEIRAPWLGPLSTKAGNFHSGEPGLPLPPVLRTVLGSNPGLLA